MPRTLPDVIVPNMHRRFTGVSATIRALVPVQRKLLEVGVIDTGGLGLGGEWSFREVAIAGFRGPGDSSCRIWHARRHVEMLAGLFLRDILFQRWKLVFTTATARAPGPVTRFLIARMDLVVAVSSISARQRAPRATVVFHGVDCDRFQPPGRTASAGDNKLFPGKRVVGCVGRIRPAKGSDMFVDAMIDVLPGFPDCVALLVGACQPKHEAFKSSLEARIDQAGMGDRIVFLDQRDQASLIRIYQEMEICVACSRHEGFGITPLEAFACGTPVIATRTGAWPALVDDEVGSLIEIGDTDALARCLKGMLSEPDRTRAMGVVARQRALERHSIEREAGSLVEIYRDLMRESAPRKSGPAGKA